MSGDEPAAPGHEAEASGTAPSGRPRRHRRVVRQGTEQGDVAGLGGDERDPAEKRGNDARLREDVPPHWEPSRRF